MAIYRAAAKINLTLEVLARRDDGYHALRSVMVPLELADELSIEPSDAFAFTCDRPELAGADNLAVRALHALGSLPSVRLALNKRIPTQAGLGGGSSDAAAVLRAAMDGAFGPQPSRDWPGIARSLGSDVPFFLAGTGALVEGTGERVTPLGALPAWHVLVVKPPAAVSTAAAYAELDRHERPSRPRASSVSIEVLTALQRGDFDAVQDGLSNDFQTPIAAMEPAIETALGALREAGASNAVLAGSGACVFTLAPDGATIGRIERRLSLPPSHVRFVTAFAATPDWRS
ncbi:MAG: 4-(cytidine 5'-diphospho)-2-C-methyl-D-erythritol kinase [Candidatus Eremiobacteraeota bacterium]|nr:4-(cytidine 5'-diphospho)-2-C-methyl-D-erythritol kinase [Candidatus Eremiobacteraeota bacterium]